MPILFNQKQDCCGCTACRSICPKQAINMRRDQEGFLYPQVNATRCSECGRCQTVCPLQKTGRRQPNVAEPLVYALKHKSVGIRMASSSGGAYTAISDLVLAKNVISDGPAKHCSPAVCYGAAFDIDFCVRHQGATTLAGRDRFRGSKYVQSELDTVFTQIKQNLLTGQTVLFTGTPCQTAGLQKYLDGCQINQANLICNDLICHGTPSPLLWQQYVTSLETRQRSKLKAYSFRSKEAGWEGYPARAEFYNGRIRVDTDDVRLFTRIFFTHLALRPSCYHCKFANSYRPSDLTIGDFWGIENLLPDFKDALGVSLVIVNTAKGQAVFEQLKEAVFFQEVKFDACLPYQHNLRQPTGQPPHREYFWQDYAKFGFAYVAQKYAGVSWSGKIKRCLKQGLRRLGVWKIVKRVSMR